MPSFSIPLTGLEADSTALNTIANDLANMNTTAFKSQTTNFSDLFYQELGVNGANDPLQVGAGTQVASTSTDFSGGAISSTGQDTDIAINGDGFFVVRNGTLTVYTRAGNFGLDNNGNLTTASGAQVMGYPATNGVVNTNAPLVPIQLPIGQVEQPHQTANLTVTATLDATATSTSAPEQTQVPIYDSLGVAHTATVSYSRQATVPTTDPVPGVVSEWTGTISLPAGDFTSGTSIPTTVDLGFDSSGKLLSINGVATPNAGGTQTNAAISFTGLADTASSLNFNWNMFGTNGQPVVSQVASSAGIGTANQDGFAGGKYQGFTVDANGVVSAKFDNGQTTQVGQLAIATVVNEQGMVRTGDNEYETTLSSGSATVGTANSGNRGSLEDDALEGSNVDVSTEFSNLIIAQRAFEANSKAVTTFDQVTEQAINMIH